MTSRERTRRALMMAVPGLCLAGRAYAQEAEPAVRIGPQPEETSITYELDAWVDEWGRPTAKVMLNGQGPFRFMVDTGSTTTVMASRLLERVGAAQVGITTVHGTTGVADMPIANVRLLETGAVKKKDVMVAVLPDYGLGREDGILGADVFAGKRLTFDIRNKSVRVDATHRGTIGMLRPNLRLRNGSLAEINGKVGSVKAKLMIDTGGQKCIVNPKLEAMLRQAHPRMPRYDRAHVIGVTGHVLTGSYLAPPTIQMEMIQINDAVVVAADAPIFRVWGLENEPAMIVGVEVLSRLAAFSIDYGAKYFDGVIMAEMAKNQNMVG
jgi:Aspartyl protease